MLREMIIIKTITDYKTKQKVIEHRDMSFLKKYILHDTFLGIHYYDYRNTLVVSESYVNHNNISSTSTEIYKSKIINKDNQSTRNLQYYTKQVKPMSSFKIKRL